MNRRRFFTRKIKKYAKASKKFIFYCVLSYLNSQYENSFYEKTASGLHKIMN